MDPRAPPPAVGARAGDPHRRAGVVLAGGLSRRFGSEKLLARLHGRTLLAHAVEALRAVTDEVYISVDTQGHARRLLPQLPRGVGILLDLPVGGGGPATGISTAVRLLDHEELLFLPGDAPWVHPDALRTLIRTARERDLDVAAPFGVDGMTDALVQYQRRRAVLSLLDDPELALVKDWPRRPTDLLRGAWRAGLVAREHLSRDPGCFRNVNVPSDLEEFAPVPQKLPQDAGESPAGRATFLGVPSRAAEAHRTAHVLRGVGHLTEASELFEREAWVYRGLGVRHLEGHCLIDAGRCRIGLHPEPLPGRRGIAPVSLTLRGASTDDVDRSPSELAAGPGPEEGGVTTDDEPSATVPASRATGRGGPRRGP